MENKNWWIERDVWCPNDYYLVIKINPNQTNSILISGVPELQSILLLIAKALGNYLDKTGEKE